MKAIHRASKFAIAICALFTVFAGDHVTSVALADEANALAPTVLDLIDAHPKLLTFKKALDRSGISRDLMQGTNVTVFAPTNAAFDVWPADELAKLFEQPAALGSLVEIHLVDGLVSLNDLASRQYLITRLGRLVSVMHDDPYILINDARVVDGDLKAVNGRVHIIDTVLEP